jgi:hypothetical protein
MILSRIALSVLGPCLATAAIGAAPVAPTAPTNPELKASPEIKASIAFAKLYDPKADVRTGTGDPYVKVTGIPGRTQRVYFYAKPAGPVDAKHRLIYAVGAILPLPIDAARATKLLQENYDGLPYGAWSMGTSTTGKQMIIYTVEVPENARTSTIRDVVTTVAVRADALDLELTGKDSQ